MYQLSLSTLFSSLLRLHCHPADTQIERNKEESQRAMFFVTILLRSVSYTSKISLRWRRNPIACIYIINIIIANFPEISRYNFEVISPTPSAQMSAFQPGAVCSVQWSNHCMCACVQLYTVANSLSHFRTHKVFRSLLFRSVSPRLIKGASVDCSSFTTESCW